MSDTTTAANEFDITLFKNRDTIIPIYFRDIENEPIDITGWSGDAQVRESMKGDSVLIMDLVVTIADAALGKIEVKATKVASIVCQDAGKWDLVMTNADGNSSTYLVGSVTFEDAPTQI